MRINKYIAQYTGLSRRSADELIEKKWVQINRRPARMGEEVQEGQEVHMKTHTGWKEVVPSVQQRTIVLVYKPHHTLTSRTAEHGMETIYSILPREFQRLKPAGRLDYESEGLMVLTDDGNLIQHITHPKYGTKKLYLVGLESALSNRELGQIAAGIKIDNYLCKNMVIGALGEEKKKYSYLQLQPGLYWYYMQLLEGRNNQIRKVMGRLGKTVKRLIRLKHGEYELSEELKEQGFIQVT